MKCLLTCFMILLLKKLGNILSHRIHQNQENQKHQNIQFYNILIGLRVVPMFITSIFQVLTFRSILWRNWLSHCVKSIQIWSFSGPYFPYSVRMRENTDQKKLPIWKLFTQWVVSAVEKRFNQPSYHPYEVMENLLLK